MEQIDYEVDEFIDYCTSKNLLTKTIGSYEQTLRLLTQYLKDNYKVVEYEVNDTLIKITPNSWTDANYD